MREKPNETLTAAAITLLLRELPEGADIYDRRRIYKRLRDYVMEKANATGQGNGYDSRLAVEYAIQKVERQLSGISEEGEARQADNAWLLIDPTSSFYVLSREPQMDSAAEKLFNTPSAKEMARSTGPGYRLRVILSLWLRAINHEASHDRIGYIWLILDPLIHVMIICFVSLFIHQGTNFDMPSFPFGVIGACFWLTFRTAAIGSMFGGGVLKPQLEHPTVRRFDIMTARAVNALIIFFGVGTWLMGLAMWMRLATWPVNLPGFLLCLILVWVTGLLYGIVANSLLLLYPGYRRMNGFIIRIIAIMSGLFYVSEQLPDGIKSIMLLNPLLHLVQFARSFWFYEYQTRDSSAIYVVFWLLGLGLLALACLTVDEKRPDTVRA